MRTPDEIVRRFNECLCTEIDDLLSSLPKDEYASLCEKWPGDYEGLDIDRFYAEVYGAWT